VILNQKIDVSKKMPLECKHSDDDLFRDV
jgi:hypothetical protein